MLMSLAIMLLVNYINHVFLFIFESWFLNNIAFMQGKEISGKEMEWKRVEKSENANLKPALFISIPCSYEWKRDGGFNWRTTPIIQSPKPNETETELYLHSWGCWYLFNNLLWSMLINTLLSASWLGLHLKYTWKILLWEPKWIYE